MAKPTFRSTSMVLRISWFKLEELDLVKEADKLLVTIVLGGIFLTMEDLVRLGADVEVVGSEEDDVGGLVYLSQGT